MSVPVFGVVEPGRQYVERIGAYGFLREAAGSRLAIVETPMGFFLPGGGADPGESVEAALHREIFEEIGLHASRMSFLCQAVQYHWSEFYQQHFKKVGSFFEVAVQAYEPVVLQRDHLLHWWTRDVASRKLSQEFQRWAVTQTNG